MKLFLQKHAKFSSAGGFPLNPQAPTAGGFAPRPPLASGGWGLRPQTPQTAPPHCEFLATRLAKVASVPLSLKLSYLEKLTQICIQAKPSKSSQNPVKTFFWSSPNNRSKLVGFLVKIFFIQL